LTNDLFGITAVAGLESSGWIGSQWLQWFVHNCYIYCTVHSYILLQSVISSIWH